KLLISPNNKGKTAQSEGATGKPFARYWAHNGLLNLGAEKMSKSLGNPLAIRELVQRPHPEAIRLYLLGAHYRHPFDFSSERIEESGRALARLRLLVAGGARPARPRS